MSETVVGLVKLAVALSAALACYQLSRPSRVSVPVLGPAREPVAKGTRAASAALLVCAVLALGAYFQLGRLPAGLVHRWEMFHYYVGAKYHPELGYQRLYRCAAIADAEDGVPSRPERKIRDLRTDGVLLAADAVAAPELCKPHFSAARWSEFKSDVRFFRRGLGKAWTQSQLDHGYNPPPLWSATWGKLVQQVPVGVRRLQLLAGIDLALMSGVLVTLAACFNLRTAALAAVFWGTQAASDFGWTGGGLGRQDWLFFAVLGLGLLRRNHYAWAGAALACSGQLRLFPLLLLAGASLVFAARWFATKRLPDGARRFVAGAALATSLGVGVSLAQSGVEDYREFWSHIQLRHHAVVNNHMGLRTLLSAAPVEVSVEATSATRQPHWLAERRERLARFGTAFQALGLALAALVGVAIWQARRAWLGVALATAFVPLLLDPANYYYSCFVLLVPLFAQRRAFGVLLCVTAAGGQLLCLRFAAPEARFVALSCLYVGVSVFIALSLVRLPSLSWSFGEARHAK